MTQKVKMPVPVAWLQTCRKRPDSHALTYNKEVPALKNLGYLAQGLITTDQAEAYAAAKVREALEGAAKICDETYVEPGDLQVESCYEAAEKIRALIPHNDSEQGE